jgi:S-DNA-T family DNA segregation ATPase FtsK/SpoIIIE
MPHLLIAGSTGSGKSVCINDIILSLLYQNSPRDLKMVLVDPKKVELSVYNGLPHLLTPVVTEVDKTINALKWAVSEMEGRYSLFQKKGKRDIKSYNEANKDEKLPYIVIVIDELADLMVTSRNEVEGAIVRLAQLARATGIHLVVATQRPSVDVITGLIKANISTRIAFAVSSQIDSRTILDQSGAEKLMGNGDMLYQASDVSKPRRIQGAFTTEEEADKVSGFIKDQECASYNEEVVEKKHESSSFSEGGEEEPLFREAVEEVINAGKASASLLQRRLKVGYARAARLLDILEEKGIIGPQDGARPRDVYIHDLAELEQAKDEVSEESYNDSDEDLE